MSGEKYYKQERAKQKKFREAEKLKFKEKKDF
jgi:hypothetical protein